MCKSIRINLPSFKMGKGYKQEMKMKKNVNTQG